MRQAAIERSAGIVIEDKEEDLIHGWTLSVPTQANLLKTATFEEAVLLLTAKALYFCRLDWGTEKVREFERIPLDEVQAIFRGTYITSTLAERHMNEAKNVGFVLRYRYNSADLDGGELVRRNTRSLDSGNTGAPSDHKSSGSSAEGSDVGGRFLAFKALPPRSSVAPSSSAANVNESTSATPENEVEVVRSVCEEIAREANRKRKQAQEEDQGRKELLVEEKDVISAADAKKSTGYLEQLGYSLKKLVWS